ncbi:MAG: DUF5794 domain-containing protein, partial [Halobacteriales archaeon]|nr:DUF5794 domain-containing protein [Halobacteriales archaeon]
RRHVDLDRFRFGSAVALGTLPLGLLGVVPGNAPLAVLAVTALSALDPEGSADRRRAAGLADGADGSVPRLDRGEEERAPWL